MAFNTCPHVKPSCHILSMHAFSALRFVSTDYIGIKCKLFNNATQKKKAYVDGMCKDVQTYLHILFTQTFSTLHYLKRRCWFQKSRYLLRRQNILTKNACTNRMWQLSSITLKTFFPHLFCSRFTKKMNVCTAPQ